MTLRIGSLFSGIGGFELGLERGLGARASTAWQVELEPYCRAVLRRHWPDAARHTDVREVGARNLEPVDIVCGGFPCQDLSVANRDPRGLAGPKSGLWWEMHRIVREMKPAYVFAENVRGLRNRGLDVVLASLNDIGYDAAWTLISAADVGAPHGRDRLWIVASRRGVPPVMLPGALELRLDVWPWNGSDPELWERGVPRTIPPLQDRTRARRRIHALGNAVVPQIPEALARAMSGHFTLTAPRPVDGPRIWPTPTVMGNGASPLHGGKSRMGLQTALRMWPTPVANDAANVDSPGQSRLHTPPLAVAVGPGRINPDWEELLMGYEQGWTLDEM